MLSPIDESIKDFIIAIIFQIVIYGKSYKNLIIYNFGTKLLKIQFNWYALSVLQYFIYTSIKITSTQNFYYLIITSHSTLTLHN